MATSTDVEKSPLPLSTASSSPPNDNHQATIHSGVSRMPETTTAPSSSVARAYRRFERHLLAYNFEPRGIARVLPHERQPGSGYIQAGLLWFSVNLAANNVTLGMLGPAVFGLSFVDASLCSVLGALVGSLGVAYVAHFGPRSGCRSLVVSRFAMGWWPTKGVVLLNVVVLLGYAMIDAVVAGQILSAVSPHGSLSVVVGIVVVGVIAWAICGFGYSIIHSYLRYAWLPQLVAFCVLAGVAGPRFDTASVTVGNASTRVGNRLSFFGICLSAAITYSGEAADYFVYYPETAPASKLFAAIVTGLMTSFAFTFVLGIGLASGIGRNNVWATAYDVSQGALLVEGYAPLGGFGKFCAVIVALGLIANLIPPTYSSGVDFQVLGRLPSRVPRLIWNTIGVVIYTVCAIAGRSHLAEIFTNFLALMGYWVVIWIAIILCEHLVFRRRKGFDWTAWDDRGRLPLGIAATVAFLVGWAGAIICMAQVWYVGPLAKLVGDFGADMGNYVGFSWAAIAFLPLRYLELRMLLR